MRLFASSGLPFSKLLTVRSSAVLKQMQLRYGAEFLKRARRPKKRNVLSSGIVPVFLKTEPLYLLLRVYSYWDFPKGVVEKDEDPFIGALREFKEETTLENINFPWGMEYLETESYSYGKIARYYLGCVSSLEVALTPNPLTHVTEHHEYRWLTYAEARPLLVPRVQRVLDWANGFVQNIRNNLNPEIQM